MQTLKRRATFFVQNVYVILFSMPTMSFFAFAVPGDGENADGGFVGGFEARCQITLTLMLTSVAYKFYLEGMLPKAPYLTLLDSYVRPSRPTPANHCTLIAPDPPSSGHDGALFFAV